MEIDNDLDASAGNFTRAINLIQELRKSYIVSKYLYEI